MRGPGLFAVATVLSWNVAVAQEETARPVEHSPAFLSYFSKDSLQLLFYGGTLTVADEPQFQGVGNSYSWGLGLTADLASHPHIGFDIELLSLSREFDTPLSPPFLGTIDNETQVETLSMLLGGRLFYPGTGAFRAYASGGLGYYRTDMRVSGTLLGLPGSYTESDADMRPYYGAGMHYNFDTWSLGLHYRHNSPEGSFGKFGIDDAALGGDSYMLGIGLRFR